MEQESVENIKDSSTKDVIHEEELDKCEAPAEGKHTENQGTKDGGDQFTEPELLDTGTVPVDQYQAAEDDQQNEKCVLYKVLGEQKVEQMTGTSSENEVPDTPEKLKKRRKKRPKNISEESLERHKKIQHIQDLLSSTPIDLEVLRQLATSNCGLVKDELRRKAWPRLMMIDHMEVTPKPTLDVIKAHKDYQQVVLDVNRSLKRFPPGIDDDYRLILMDQLTTLIIRILIKHSELHYYQGFHDVAITFLLVMGEDVGYAMVEQLSVTHLSEFMRPTMEKTTYYLTYIYPILRRADPNLCEFLIKSSVGTVFCLPWLITWFAHTLSDYRNVVRLYDYFLASPYLMPMYIAAAIVLHKKEDILAGECDMAMQHFILSQVPDTLPIEDLMVEASKLYDKYPPDTLQDEVNQFLEKKAEEERLEKQQILERRKKFEAARRGDRYTGILATVSRYIPPAQRKMLVKVAFFALTAYLATSAYSYYSNSAVVFPFVSRR